MAVHTERRVPVQSPFDRRTDATLRGIGAQTGEWLSSILVPPRLARDASSCFGAHVPRARVRGHRARIECDVSGGTQASHDRSAHVPSVSRGRSRSRYGALLLAEAAWLGLAGFPFLLLAGAFVTRWWILPSLRWRTSTADEKWTCVIIVGFLLVEVYFLKPYQLTILAIALGIEAAVAGAHWLGLARSKQARASGSAPSLLGG